MKTKKIPILITGVVVCSILVVSLLLKAKNAAGSEEVTVTKETTVAKGSITAGITESGSVTVGTNSITFDLDLSSGSSSSSSSSSQSTTSNTTSNINGMSQSFPPSSSGNSANSSNSTNSSSASSSSEGSLVVDTVYAAVGQSVKVGDKLMSLTEDSVKEVRQLLEDGVASAKLALTEAKITDKQIKISAESEYNLKIAQGKSAKAVYNSTINAIDSNISSLKEQIANTTDSNRLTNLKDQLAQAQNEEASKKLKAKQTYELAILDYDNAKAAYDVAMKEYGTATSDAEDALADAKDKLSAFETFVGTDNTLYSTYEGRISAIGYAEGDVLSSNTPIAQLSDVTAVTISVNVTQDDIAAVNLGDEVNVEFVSDSTKLYKGTISAIDSAVTTSSAVSYPVTILLSTTPEKVLTGMTASVTFISKEVEDVLYVSNKAIYTEGTKSYVKIKKKDGTTEKTEVTTGFSNGENVEIKSGLSEGDTVLIESKVNG